MRKVLSLVLALCMISMLTACGGGGTTTTAAAAAETTAAAAAAETALCLVSLAAVRNVQNAKVQKDLHDS